MDRKGRLSSARPWLAAQQGRPPERIARSYRKRYGLDWACAIQELSALGIAFSPKWREHLKCTFENQALAKARRREEQEKTATGRSEFSDSDDTFAFIAGYTEGGAPYGTTWEEKEEIERRWLDTPIKPPTEKDAPTQDHDDSLPF